MIFQRIQTYTLNSIIKKIVTVLFLIIGLFITGHAILTPLLMVIVMITGDFLAMALTTDNVRASPMPNAWRIGSLTMAGIIMAVCLLAFCSGVLLVGKFELGLGIDALRTLAFTALVCGSQATIYAIRQHRRLWGSCPSPVSYTHLDVYKRQAYAFAEPPMRAQGSLGREPAAAHLLSRDAYPRLGDG